MQASVRHAPAKVVEGPPPAPQSFRPADIRCSQRHLQRRPHGRGQRPLHSLKAPFNTGRYQSTPCGRHASSLPAHPFNAGGAFSTLCCICLPCKCRFPPASLPLNLATDIPANPSPPRSPLSSASFPFPSASHVSPSPRQPSNAGGKTTAGHPSTAAAATGINSGVRAADAARMSAPTGPDEPAWMPAAAAAVVVVLQRKWGGRAEGNSDESHGG